MLQVSIVLSTNFLVNNFRRLKHPLYAKAIKWYVSTVMGESNGRKQTWENGGKDVSTPSIREAKYIHKVKDEWSLDELKDMQTAPELGR